MVLLLTRRALIIGASRNIGKAVAEALADAGHSVALNARSESELDEAVSGILERGGRAVSVPGDISEESGSSSVVDASVEALGGPIDILVHCATSRLHQNIEDMSLDAFHLPLKVGLDGAFLLSRAVLPGMREARWGRLIFMTGLRGLTGNPGLAAVAATKSGMTGLMKALAHEYASTGVTVNAVSPGRIRTERVDSRRGDPQAAAANDAKRSKGIPMGRMGAPEEVAAACLYLVSDSASFVTGQTLHINGGMYMP